MSYGERCEQDVKWTMVLPGYFHPALFHILKIW
jgi:hypothetical protein